MLLLLNLLLLPPCLLLVVLIYFHIFGGPLPHHYLYTATVAGPAATPAAEAAARAALAVDYSPTVAAAEASSEAAAGMQPGVKSNSGGVMRWPGDALTRLRSMLQTLLVPPSGVRARAPNFISLLHRIRVTLLGVDERTQRMRLFRRTQAGLWRLYKLLLRRLTNTGELERMIVEAQITMVPLGSVLTERVGFHPHLVSLAVRVSAYLRSSKQLAEVLALEEESAAQERLARQAAAAARRAAGGGPMHSRGLSEFEASMDEDETPISTPSLSALQGLSGDAGPSPMVLDGRYSVTRGSPSFSPILSMAAQSMGSPTAPAHITAAAVAGSASSVYEPAFLKPFSPSRTFGANVGASASSSAGVDSTLQPPPLLLSPNGSDESSVAVAADARANHLLQLLVAVKHINRTAGASYSNQLRPILYRSLCYRNSLNDFLRFELGPALEVKYDSSNPAHEAWLAELWTLYMPAGPGRSAPASRISNEWQLLGFQGSDPATDFRGMGVLGLRNLMEFARLAPIQSGLIMRRAQEQGLKSFGMAIAGITLTADLVKMAQGHVLDAYFYTYGADWNSWHALYATMFIRFDEVWQEAKPENVMAFSAIHSSFLSQFECEAHAFPFSHATLASDTFRIQLATPITPRIVSLVDEMSHDNGESGDEERGEGALAEDDEFFIEGATRVTERLSLSGNSRRGSKSATHWALSRSTSPLSHSRSALAFSSEPSSGSGSPCSPMALSCSETIEANGGVQPLGNLLDPIISPMLFKHHPLPPFTANTV